MLLQHSIESCKTKLSEYKGFIKNIQFHEDIIRSNFKDERNKDKMLIKFNQDVVKLIKRYSPATDKTTDADRQQQQQ